MEQEIINIIKKRGPLTGSELQESLDAEGFITWQACKLSKKLTVRIVGTRYLRLDRRVEGFARLSPSILREFLTYSIIGLSEDRTSIEKKATALLSQVEDISKTKLELAYRIVGGLANQLPDEWERDNQVCFIIAGDIVYNMAHDVPRPERSTGKVVCGSDMDLVVVVDNQFPEDLIKKLDNAIYQEKYRLLITPHMKEEIDYIVKKMDRVREQVRFDTFNHMVACKIMHEGTFLDGSEELFSGIKALLKENSVPEKLDALEKRARAFREDAESRLLRLTPGKIKDNSRHLFYPTEESEEFE